MHRLERTPGDPIPFQDIAWSFPKMFYVSVASTQEVSFH